jgi:transcriptional regulator with GAF, ATPase, and Fis domain
VSITGETGTGKEVLAREIHRLSPRGHRPMHAINCGAIPDALVESELFGHERGAFTGADRRHVGAFERAHRSTLFLDEIAELPPAAQTKLLRVLQERRLRRVGGVEEIEVDVRLITATQRPLATLVREGRFRADLHYRLDVLSIAIPPLRERRDDIPPLVAALVADLSQRLAIAPPPVSRAVVERLASHRWPGNVRELANVLEAAIILGEGRTLALPDAIGGEPHAPGPAFEDAMRRTIEAALRETRGKIYGDAGAAAHLGLEPSTLQSKMKRLGIVRARFTGGAGARVRSAGRRRRRSSRPGSGRG